MHEKNLSSAWTFWAKFVLPVCWISVFGAGTMVLWLADFHHGNNALPPPMKFVFLAVWILGSTLILWANAGLKRVRMDEQQLYVSNYIKEISIPFNAIIDVTQNRWINSRPVTIYFRGATEFGDQAKFMPKQFITFQFWRVDPIVDELRRLAGLVSDV
jgi:hypothetical protein